MTIARTNTPGKSVPGKTTPGIAAPASTPASAFPRAAFGPCSHLTQVLGTATVRTQFLKQYALGVRVARFVTRGADATTLDHALQAARAATLKCHECALATTLLFLCLQCSYIGCAAHFPRHTDTSGHVFAVDILTGFLKCFKCGDFIGAHDLDANAHDDTNWIVEHSRLPSYKATTGLRGMVNMGATCFISSVLQTLIHNPYVRNHFLAGSHADCCVENCITCCVDEIFTEFYSKSEVNGYGPTRLLTVAWKTKRALAGYSEQDAHEFWQFIVDEIHRARVRDHAKGAHGEVCDCITHSTFRGELQSTTTCGSCGASTVTVDPMLDLSLEIPASRAPTLASCLDKFTAEEHLDVQYPCSRCGERARAISKRLRVQTLPRVFGVQLKRFEHNGASTKIETHVAFPLFVDLAPYTLAGETATYELFALVVHIGSVLTGHYISVIKSQGQWFRLDDSMVALVTEKEVLLMKAYLLFYAVHVV
ncbi:hypothetical protein BABINDRAFT_9967 [Babjeviella inositovora NRRL Y-12698]|uniref:Ubiquitin carboxyl-terminal hydrolase n=1 Tax=Babjeviella inositovora NRRL Y-12698 TaxID=984486 RepID=A0A1E3QIV6_9ASCO|nr:uncharacterized protein BABINDRAFT_9967 [Babjeviella inositovora NRRL Y-12698]ODQ77625.1 hypothetical protein BABINDRAFT_9967 [Babjeviella inositovora NRRL Y-12698]